MWDDGGDTEPYWGKRGGTQSPIGMERNPEPYGDVGDGHTGPYWRPHGALQGWREHTGPYRDEGRHKEPYCRNPEPHEETPTHSGGDGTESKRDEGGAKPPRTDGAHRNGRNGVKTKGKGNKGRKGGGDGGTRPGGAGRRGSGLYRESGSGATGSGALRGGEPPPSPRCGPYSVRPRPLPRRAPAGPPPPPAPPAAARPIRPSALGYPSRAAPAPPSARSPAAASRPSPPPGAHRGPLRGRLKMAAIALLLPSPARAALQRGPPLAGAHLARCNGRSDWPAR